MTRRRTGGWFFLLSASLLAACGSNDKGRRAPEGSGGSDAGPAEGAGGGSGSGGRAGSGGTGAGGGASDGGRGSGGTPADGGDASTGSGGAAPEAGAESGAGGGPAEAGGDAGALGLAPPGKLVAGQQHTCAVLADGTAACWGYNSSAQIGAGTFDNWNRPYVLPGLTDVVALGAGERASCAVLGDGSVSCWGDSTATMPTAMGFTGVFARSVAMGSSHRCLVTRDDDVHCWGTGGSGQLGDGLSTPYSATLVRPTYAGGAPLTDVAEVSLGFSHTCALKRDGTVACWGASDLDAIANGGNPSAVVRDVPGVTTAVSLATGTYHTCVALADGTAACWGALTGVGSGAAAASPTPVVVPGLTNVARVAAGDGVTCAHLRNRNLLCWGYAGTVDESYVPRTVALPDVTAVAAGRHTCALVADGSVECWGTNQYGQLGVGHNNAINSGPNPGVSTVVGGNVFFTP